MSIFGLLDEEHVYSPYQIFTLCQSLDY